MHSSLPLSTMQVKCVGGMLRLVPRHHGSSSSVAQGLATAAQYADACPSTPPEAREDNVRVIIRVISAAGRTQLFMCHLPGGGATRQATGVARREGLRAVTRRDALGLHAGAWLKAALTGTLLSVLSARRTNF